MSIVTEQIKKLSTEDLLLDIEAFANENGAGKKEIKQNRSFLFSAIKVAFRKGISKGKIKEAVRKGKEESLL